MLVEFLTFIYIRCLVWWIKIIIVREAWPWRTISELSWVRGL